MIKTPWFEKQEELLEEWKDKKREKMKADEVISCVKYQQKLEELEKLRELLKTEEK